MSGSTSKRYPVELRERAVRMVAGIRGGHESEWAAMRKVAELLGVGTPETVQEVVSAGRGRRRHSCRCHLRGGC
jgi:transposase